MSPIRHQMNPTATPRYREAATTARARVKGAADQIGHEQRGRIDRDALKTKLAESKQEVRRTAAKRIADKARDAKGTMGDSLGR